MLAGLVGKAAILLVDYTQQLRRRGKKNFTPEAGPGMTAVTVRSSLFLKKYADSGKVPATYE